MNKEFMESLIERKEGTEKVIKDLQEQTAQYKTKNTTKHEHLLIQKGFLMALEVVLKDIEYYEKKKGSDEV